jgi:hypothetical protein
MIPAFSHFFLNRRRALSKDSPSLTLIPGKKFPPLRPSQLIVLVGNIKSARG